MSRAPAAGNDKPSHSTPATNRGSRWRWVVYPSGVVALLAVLGALIGGHPTAADAYEPADLPGVEARVRSDHAAVPHLRSAEFEALRNAAAPLVFDVRDPDEFAVSRIEGAYQVDPDISADAFLARYGALAAGRDLVFYCSVGVRSARLIERTRAQLQALGAGAIYNLEGGLFRWHNESRGLIDASGATERIHPYNSYWGGLIARQDQVALTPR